MGNMALLCRDALDEVKKVFVEVYRSIRMI